MDTVRILLVEDHQIVREGLRRMLELEPDIKVVGEAATAEEAYALAAALSLDIVLMDIKMPSVNGLEATQELKASPELVPPAAAPPPTPVMAPAQGGGTRVRLTLKAPWAAKQLALVFDEAGHPRVEAPGGADALVAG